MFKIHYDSAIVNRLVVVIGQVLVAAGFMPAAKTRPHP